MKLTRKNVTLGLVTLGLVGGLAGAGAALAATTSPAPTPSVSTTAANGHCGGMSGSMFGTNSPMSAAASYLVLSPTELRAQMQAGTPLTDIAKARGKSVSGLKAAMVAAMKKNLEANTALTAKQKAAMLAQMKEHLDAMLTMTMSQMSGMDMDTGGMGSHMGGRSSQPAQESHASHHSGS